MHEAVQSLAIMRGQAGARNDCERAQAPFSPSVALKPSRATTSP